MDVSHIHISSININSNMSSIVELTFESAVLEGSIPSGTSCDVKEGGSGREGCENSEGCAVGECKFIVTTYVCRIGVRYVEALRGLREIQKAVILYVNYTD